MAGLPWAGVQMGEAVTNARVQMLLNLNRIKLICSQFQFLFSVSVHFEPAALAENNQSIRNFSLNRKQGFL